MPDLVAYNDAGEPETVKYHLLPSLLLNELQRQQRTIHDQARALRELREELTQLKAAVAAIRH